MLNSKYYFLLTGLMVVVMHNVNHVGADIKESSNHSRQGRFFGLFNLVTFSNSMCNSTVNSRMGLCFTDAECVDRGGTNGGSCASGFGVCCIFERNCDNARDEAVSVQYIQNVDFPRRSTSAEMCLININVVDSSICQLRLDFEEFKMDEGSTLTTPCDRDSVEILSSGSGDALGIGKLCGDNGGQHIYIPVESRTSSPMLRILTEDRSGMANISSGFVFNIKVSQIDCNDQAMTSLRAPDNCRQYYRERSGTINSLNWFAGTRSSYNTDLNYAICIRRESSDCQLLLRRAASAPPGTTSVGQSSGYSTTICGTENGCGAVDCVKSMQVGNQKVLYSDRIEVGAIYEKGNNANAAMFAVAGFFCGVGLGNDLGAANTANTIDGTDERQGVVLQSGGPFVLRFLSDDTNNVNTNNPGNMAVKVENEIGFSIDYARQTSCTMFELGSS